MTSHGRGSGPVSTRLRSNKRKGDATNYSTTNTKSKSTSTLTPQKRSPRNQTSPTTHTTPQTRIPKIQASATSHKKTPNKKQSGPGSKTMQQTTAPITAASTHSKASGSGSSTSKRKVPSSSSGTPSNKRKKPIATTPPNIAVQSSETPNLFVGTEEVPAEQVVLGDDLSSDPKVTAHKTLFYEQIITHYKTVKNRAFMSRREMDGLVHIIKGDVTSTTATSYKLKRDFAVLAFGDHYSLVLRKDVLGKEEVDVSTVPRYCAYEDLFEAISKCHIDQEGHSGIRKTEKLVRHHYVNICPEQWLRNLLHLAVANWIGSILPSQMMLSPLFHLHSTAEVKLT
jgi:hypothetical protein